jgi:signal transduction histidine kinase
LRTPLNVILGRTQMLTASAADEAQRHAAEAVARNAVLLARLVDDLLDVSRITLGQVRLELQPVPFDQVVSSVVTALEPTARARGVAITVENAVGSVSLLADATRLQQVTWNLLSNAIKFTPPDGRVTVRLERRASHAALVVADTGAGIEPSFLPHVFEMFRQAEPATTRQHGGLGLGLSIVRRLVELHGGSVAAFSAGAGTGTTFTVLLPVPVVAGAV